ncbi:MAG: cupin domain-containing protein [Deltaproteobacteria bacterium]|nr:cupin domain-containing protein [Deltaproteobacteria bacterium]
MSRRAIILSPADRPRALNIVGERLTVLADRSSTHGYEVFLQEGPSGSGPPPHHHDWDEAFFVLEGEVDFGVGERELTATAGSFVHLPAGTRHWFRFGAAGGKMLSLTGAGSQAAAFFTGVDAALPEGEMDVAVIGRVASAHALTIDV